MAYALGIDLGTTFSAAAVHRDGRASIVELGSKSASIPSVIFLRDDETVLAGEAAQRRAASEPSRVAREFKRRLGDPTPLLLGGAAYSAEALTARLLGWVVDQVTEREGTAPDSIAITHPANWGPYKIDLLQQAVRLAGLESVELITEPEAAVRHYATHERVEPGSVIAVFDLGGGTFDAAILHKSDSGFEMLGQPEGIERLGGIDFDAAVLGHVIRSLDGVIESLDQDDPGTVQALARLRSDCVEAKEGLSSDTDVSIPVLLPNVQTEVRLTRSEFEGMIRPSLADSLEAMRRAMSSANVTPEDVSAVLLVGGSSRIPLVAQLVSNEFGRPIAIDTDPKHAIALGASLVAADHATQAAGAVAAAVAGAAVAGAAAESADAGETSGAVTAEESPVTPQDSDPPAVEGGEVAAAATARMPAQSAEGVPTVTVPTVAAAAAAPEAGSDSKSKLPLLIGAGLAVLLALIGGLVIVKASGGDSPGEAEAAPVTGAPDSAAPAEQAAPPSTEPPVTDDASAAADASDDADASAAAAADVSADAATADDAADVSADAAAADAVEVSADAAAIPPAATPCPTGLARVACITSISIDGNGGLVAPFATTGYMPELEPIDFHIHFYFDTAVGGDEINAGTAGSGGDWRLWDSPVIFTAIGGDGGRPGYTVDDARAMGATQLCSIVADTAHAVVAGTGNCIDLPAGAL